MIRPTHILATLHANATPTTPLTPAQCIAPPADWQTHQAVPIFKHVHRLTAPNPGVMTGPGTNSYAVGTPETGYCVIDPGPADADHLARLLQSCHGDIRMIVCTHSHPDHSPGAAPLQALCAAQGLRPPILGLPSAATARAASAFVPDRALAHGEMLRLSPLRPSDATDPLHTHTLQVLHTPGHAANHICLLLIEDGILFSGDHILNGSTTVIDPPDGNMHDYLSALDMLKAQCTQHDAHFILPAHGHVITDACACIDQLTAHRLRREAKVIAAMQANPHGGPDTWLPWVYDDVDPRIWPVAKRSLLAHLERIQLLHHTASWMEPTAPTQPS
jgi:recombination protein RecT